MRSWRRLMNELGRSLIKTTLKRTERWNKVGWRPESLPPLRHSRTGSDRATPVERGVENAKNRSIASWIRVTVVEQQQQCFLNLILETLPLQEQKASTTLRSCVAKHRFSHMAISHNASALRSLDIFAVNIGKVVGVHNLYGIFNTKRRLFFCRLIKPRLKV